MNIKPLNGRVLIKVVKEQKIESKIILPEANNSKSIKGEIVSLGQEILKDGVLSSGLKVGDIVFCAKWTGTVVSDDNAQDEYIIIKYEDVLGVEGR